VHFSFKEAFFLCVLPFLFFLPPDDLLLPVDDYTTLFLEITSEERLSVGGSCMAKV